MALAVPARAEPPPRRAALRWLAPVLLVAAVVLAYANTFSSPWIFDDIGAVLNNPTIRRVGSLDIFLPPADGSTATGRPIVNATFALNYAVSGENVWSYHALNLAIHALAALTLFGLLRRTLGSLQLKPPAFNCDAVAVVAAALWALHPLNTESVTCIAQRTESLCGLFYLFTLYAFVRGSAVLQSAPTASSRRWLALSVASCLLGMATKEVMVTAPVLVFLFDRTFVARSFSAAWRARRGYYLALAATWLLLVLLLALNAGARGASAGFGLGVTPWTYLLKQCEALVLYLRLGLWPHPLVLDYGTAVTRSLTEVWWQGPVILVLLAGTVTAVCSRRPSLRALGFAGAWFFLLLAPSSSVVPLVTQTMAEHRMYLPLVAVVGLFVVALHVRLAAHAFALRLILPLLVLVAFTATIARNRDYRDAITLWTDTATKAPANPRAHHNLALALHHAGRLAEAHPHFARAVALDPAYVTAHYNWAVALLSEGRTAEALPLLDATVRLAPAHLDAHRQLAHLAEQIGRPADVETHFNAVLRLVPDDLTAHRKLGLLLARAERLAPAAEHFRAVIRLVPADADAHANLGNVLLLAGRPREAIAAYEESLRLRPGDARTRENLRVARASLP